MHLGSLFFVILTLVSATAAIPTGHFSRDVSQVESDLSAASGDLSTLNTDVQAFFQDAEPVSGKIHTDSLDSVSDLDQTLTDLAGVGSISSSAASAIHTTVSSMQTTMINICSTILSGTSSPSSSNTTFRQDLSQLSKAFDSLLSALQGDTPAPTSSQFGTMKSQFESACGFSGGPSEASFL